MKIFRRIGRHPLTDIRIMNQLFPAAEEAASADGVEAAGAEYLVIAALDLPDGTARRAFERVGADPDQYRQAIRDHHRDALRAIGMDGLDDDILDRHIPDPVTPRGPLKNAPSADRLFRAVVDQVRADRSQLYGAYVVLAAARSDKGTARGAIERMGIDPDELATAARDILDDTIAQR